MMFTVLALDYDGTIASDGVLDPEVRRAIADIRERGITVPSSRVVFSMTSGARPGTSASLTPSSRRTARLWPSRRADNP